MNAKKRVSSSQRHRGACEHKPFIHAANGGKPVCRLSCWHNKSKAVRSIKAKGWVKLKNSMGKIGLAERRSRCVSLMHTSIFHFHPTFLLWRLLYMLQSEQHLRTRAFVTKLRCFVSLDGLNELRSLKSGAMHPKTSPKWSTCYQIPQPARQTVS